MLADAENIFGRRIKAHNLKRLVEQDDARAKAVENFLGMSVKDTATGTGTGTLVAAVARIT